MVLLLERCMHFPNVSLIEGIYLFLAASSLAIPSRKLGEHHEPRLDRHHGGLDEYSETLMCMASLQLAIGYMLMMIVLRLQCLNNVG